MDSAKVLFTRSTDDPLLIGTLFGGRRSEHMGIGKAEPATYYHDPLKEEPEVKIEPSEQTAVDAAAAASIVVPEVLFIDAQDALPTRDSSTKSRQGIDEPNVQNLESIFELNDSPMDGFEAVPNDSTKSSDACSTIADPQVVNTFEEGSEPESCDVIDYSDVDIKDLDLIFEVDEANSARGSPADDSIKGHQKKFKQSLKNTNVNQTKDTSKDTSKDILADHTVDKSSEENDLPSDAKRNSNPTTQANVTAKASNSNGKDYIAILDHEQDLLEMSEDVNGLVPVGNEVDSKDLDMICDEEDAADGNNSHLILSASLKTLKANKVVVASSESVSKDIPNKKKVSKDIISNKKNYGGSGLLCSICDYETANEKRLTTHVNNRHGRTRTYSCGWCFFETKHVHAMRRHCELLHKRHLPKLVCAFCRDFVGVHHLRKDCEDVLLYNEMVRHFAIRHLWRLTPDASGNARVLCPLCPVVIDNFSGMSHHLKVEHKIHPDFNWNWSDAVNCLDVVKQLLVACPHFSNNKIADERDSSSTSSVAKNKPFVGPRSVKLKRLRQSWSNHFTNSSQEQPEEPRNHEQIPRRYSIAPPKKIFTPRIYQPNGRKQISESGEDDL